MTKPFKVLIIGAGRMGIRHAQGVVSLPGVTEIIIADINPVTLDAAEHSIKDPRCRYVLVDSLKDSVTGNIDVCIIAATASSRLSLVKLAEELGSKNILVEKPLGQSLAQVIELSDYVQQHDINCFVNLNMRLYDSFIRLRSDLQNLPQLKGEKTITVNTGTLGIGANGIHYLDLLYFLLDADEAKIVSAEISENIIPSGRGPQFGDFGGWAVIKFFRSGNFLANALISISATSTVFGSWDLVAPHGRIYFSEVEGKRIDTFRKADSELPVNRYYGDYLAPVENPIVSPFLGDLTAKWVEGLMEGRHLLPGISESIEVHRLLFNWLNHSTTHQTIFPIT